MEKYNVESYILNSQNQYVVTIETSNDLTSARVNYHNKLAAFNNAEDVQKAVVKITDAEGDLVSNFRETVTHGA